MVAQVLNFKETEFLNGLRNVFGVCECMCVCMCMCMCMHMCTCKEIDNFGRTLFSYPICVYLFLFCSSCSDILKLIQIQLD